MLMMFDGVWMLHLFTFSGAYPCSGLLLWKWCLTVDFETLSTQNNDLICVL